MKFSGIKYLLLVVALGLGGQARAEGGLLSFLKKVTTFVDSMSVRGLDPNYIEAPQNPWQLIVRGNVSQTMLTMETRGMLAGTDYTAKPSLKTVPSQYIGLWAGYRGYGLGYTVNVGGDKGSYFTFGATGGSYGINVRIHSFDNSDPAIKLDMELEGVSQEDLDTYQNTQLKDPIHVRTVFADGYYFFNGKKFSYAAAYDQSVIQKRSAGSLMAGLMYNYTRIDYSDASNGDLIYLMQGLGKVKLWQGSIGAGYAYNWVPTRGLLVNAMAMPMLTFVNKIRAYGYTTNIPEMMEDPRFWSDDISYEEWDQWYYEAIRVAPAAYQTFNSGLTFSVDARVSLTYNFGRCFFNAYGQFNNIRYHHNSSNGYLNDWFVNTSFGVRL